MRVAVVLTLFLLAGCFKDPGPPAPTDTVVPGDSYLMDPEEPEIQEEYDLLRADFRELNGSVVLAVGLRDVDVHEGLPRLTAFFDVEQEGRRSYVVRTVPDPSRGGTQIRYDLARLADGNEETIGSLCAVAQSAKEPYEIQVDLLHNMTGLEAGGAIVSLRVDVGDFESEEIFDSAQAQRQYDVKGGPNPHGETCPLVAERAQQS